MTTDLFSDAKIIESWGKNASSWTVAVREGQIESRRLVTDQAIVDTILSRSPRSVLDIGCGEGWLALELASRNIDVVGVDVVPGLIDEARCAGGGDFRAMSYEDIAAGKLNISVDVIVSNFALLGKESAEGMFRAGLSLLNSHGSFLVQTLHPVVACGHLPCTDDGAKVHGPDSTLISQIRRGGISEPLKVGLNCSWIMDFSYVKYVSPSTRIL